MKIKLFNLENDIAENTDLSEQYPGIVRQIEEIMISEHKKPEIDRFNIFTSGN
jgi:arylsulfatase